MYTLNLNTTHEAQNYINAECATSIAGLWDLQADDLQVAWSDEAQGQPKVQVTVRGHRYDRKSLCFIRAHLKPAVPSQSSLVMG